MLGQPGSNGPGLAVRDQIDDPPPLQVADERAVALTSFPGEVVDAGAAPNSTGQAA
jgi:hypothetical protein